MTAIRALIGMAITALLISSLVNTIQAPPEPKAVIEADSQEAIWDQFVEEYTKEGPQPQPFPWFAVIITAVVCIVGTALVCRHFMHRANPAGMIEPVMLEEPLILESKSSLGLGASYVLSTEVHTNPQSEKPAEQPLLLPPVITGPDTPSVPSITLIDEPAVAKPEIRLVPPVQHTMRLGEGLPFWGSQAGEDGDPLDCFPRSAVQPAEAAEESVVASPSDKEVLQSDANEVAFPAVRIATR
jgi:hypothetical protein